jgi:hypothetical protein
MKQNNPALYSQMKVKFFAFWFFYSFSYFLRIVQSVFGQGSELLSEFAKDSLERNTPWFPLYMSLFYLIVELLPCFVILFFHLQVFL